MIPFRRYIKNLSQRKNKNESLFKIRKYTTNFDFVNSTQTQIKPQIAYNLSKEGVVAEPSFLFQYRRLENNPWKIVIIDVDSNSNEIDIELAINKICNSEVKIVDIELFSERVNNNKRKNAFIYFESEEDMQKMLSNSIRAFGVNINGKRSAILSPDDKRTLLISISKRYDINFFEDLLITLGIYKEDVELFIPKDQQTGKIKGSIFATFSTHEKAYAVWKHLLIHQSSGVHAAWTQKNSSELMKLSKAKEYLERENEMLRKQLESLSAKQAKLYSEISELELENRDTDQNKYSLDLVLYEHILKTLEYSNFDRSKCLKLLNISPQKLSNLLSSLKKKGFDVTFRKN